MKQHNIQSFLFYNKFMLRYFVLYHYTVYSLSALQLFKIILKNLLNHKERSNYYSTEVKSKSWSWLLTVFILGFSQNGKKKLPTWLHFVRLKCLHFYCGSLLFLWWVRNICLPFPLLWILLKMFVSIMHIRKIICKTHNSKLI